MDPFVCEIRMFGFNFAPKGWAFCDGQLLPLSQNTAVFSLLGTDYGGDGRSTFGLPNLQGSAVLGAGQSTFGTVYDVGERSGSETVTLIESEMPQHNHIMKAHAADAGDNNVPAATTVFAKSNNGKAYGTGATNTNLAFQHLAPAGSSFPHNNMMPYLTLNFCIALQGVFPPRQ